MPNINRDYLIVLDAKSSVISDADDLKYYITDEHSQNLFINLVVRDTERINKYVEVHDPEKYKLELHIVKPNNDIVRPHLQASLLSVEDALYEFELPKEAVDYIGTYKCELRVTYQESEETTVTTSNKFKYKVKRSIYNNLDAIQDAPQYPIVIQLFDKLSDINQYEEDRRANELARQLAEEQRQTRFNTLDADMVDRVNAMDSKMDDVEARISAKEQAVDKLIVDTKVDIDDYKVAKDTEIDEYKALKDTEINEAITAQDNKIDEAIANQDNKIDEAISNQNDRIALVENNDNTQNTRLDVLEAKEVAHKARITAVETKNTEQDGRLDVAENRLNNIGEDIKNTIQPTIDAQNSRLDSIEAVNVSQGTRLDAIEIKNQQQDDRLLDVEKVNKRQDMDLKCLFAESKNNMIDVTEEGNSIYLQNSTVGYTLIDEIQGNTMVNCNKEPDKEIILNGNINTQGYSNVTLTEGVDGGLVDIALEGNTMVNVCDQRDPVAITKSYTVETGNHVALQGEYDGKCRPVVTGNTLVNISTLKYKSSDGTQEGTELLLQSLVAGKTYSLIFDTISVSNSQRSCFFFSTNGGGTQYIFPQDNPSYSTILGKHILPFTAKSNHNVLHIWFHNLEEGGVITYDNIMLLEGDYTDKPIPDYFKGLSSTFEDNLVIQEMVDSGEESPENLGKYKVDYVVTGKNKFDANDLLLHQNNNGMTVSIENGKLHIEGTTTGIYDFRPISPTYNKVLFNKVNNAPVGTSFTLSNSIGGANYWRLTRDGKTQFITNTITKQQGDSNINAFVRIMTGTSISKSEFNIQVEEGDTPTAYEPYKEHTKTLYLNSPLLEGDTIEQQGNNVVHVHRYGKVVLDGSEDEKWSMDEYEGYINGRLFKTTVSSNVYRGSEYIEAYSDKYSSIYHINNSSITEKCICTSSPKSICVSDSSYTTLESFKTWLQSNPITVVYKLATPQYEVISLNDTILCDSYTNGHLDVDSVVPIEKVDFLHFEKDLTYLYANTQYTVQFTSDKAVTVDITLGGVKLLNQDVVVGTNKYMITTPSELVDNKLVVSGVGLNIEKVVVTNTDRDFGYFEGMKSVGECERNKIEILSHSKNYFNSDSFSVIGSSSYYGSVNLSNGVYHYIGNQDNADGNYGVHIKNIKLDKNTQYTITYNLEPINNVGFNKGYIKVFGSNNKKLLGESLVGNPTFYTEDNDSIYITIYGTVGGTLSCEFKISNIQIEKGSSNTSYVSNLENKKQILLNEPLRAVGDIKDKYVLIDGKWYIERNCGEIVLDNTINLQVFDISSTKRQFYVSNLINTISGKDMINCCCDKYTSIKFNDRGNKYGVWVGDKNIAFVVDPTIYTDIPVFKEKYLSTPITVVYKLASPTYEPIDYNPFAVYSNTTHISNNSTIPCNMTIKNTGYNCLLKPSTTYTVSSNLGLNTVTTPSVLTEDCLRFYDTDTSTVTTMKDVTILEGDYTTGKPIPSHFAGIESAFEQEYDEEVGKYKVNAKVIGKNLFDVNAITNGYRINTGSQDGSLYPTEDKFTTDYIYCTGSIKFSSYSTHYAVFDKNKNHTRSGYATDSITLSGNEYFIRVSFNKTVSNLQIEQGNTATEYEPYKESIIEFYIDEPLRGIGDIKDKVYVKDDKVVVERNCSSVTLDGSNDEKLTKLHTDYEGINNISFAFNVNNISSAWNNSKAILSSTLPGIADKAWKGQQEGITSDSARIIICLNRAKLKTQDVAGFKQWLQQNPTTVVYERAEPVYEEVEYNDVKLFIESFKNSTLFYNSNIPVTSTINYTYSVPLVDTVAQTANVTDQQDSMIIDLATQCAIMEMYLM